MDKTLKNYLENHFIKYIKHEHPAVFTVEESKKIKTKYTGLHTKSLFLKDTKNNFYLVCMLGEKRLNTKILRKYFKIRKLNFASPEELKIYLKVAPGSVSIFCAIYHDSIALILDKDIWQAKSAGFHPNINTSTLELDRENLEKFYNSLKCKKFILKL